MIAPSLSSCPALCTSCSMQFMLQSAVQRTWRIGEPLLYSHRASLPAREQQSRVSEWKNQPQHTKPHLCLCSLSAERGEEVSVVSRWSREGVHGHVRLILVVEIIAAIKFKDSAQAACIPFVLILQ